MFTTKPATGALIKLEESVELAAALTASLANEYNLRALFVKGSSAVAAGMRPTRSSADTDVLVHPDDVVCLISQLSQRGWKLRPAIQGMGIPTHSHTAYHLLWGCDIDIHFRFPGLDAESSQAFETLSLDSNIHYFGGVPARVPSRAGMLVVQITHALRNLQENGELSYTAKSDYDFLLDHPDPVAWEDLFPILDGTLSWGSMRKFLLEAYPEETKQIRFPGISEDWELRTKNFRRGHLRLVVFLQAPWQEKPMILWRSIFPSRQDLAAKHLPLLDASCATLAKYRWVRVIGFARDLHNFVKRSVPNLSGLTDKKR